MESWEAHPVKICFGATLPQLVKKVMERLIKDVFKRVESAGDADVIITTQLALIDPGKWYILIKAGKDKEEPKTLPPNVTIFLFEKVINKESMQLESFLIEISDQLKFRKLFYT